MLVWFIEEKAAVRNRAVDLERKGCFKSIRPHLFFMASVGEWADGSYPPSQGPERLTLASLQQTEVGNLLRSPSPALPWVVALRTTTQRQGSTLVFPFGMNTLVSKEARVSFGIQSTLKATGPVNHSFLHASWQPSLTLPSVHHTLRQTWSSPNGDQHCYPNPQQPSQHGGVALPLHCPLRAMGTPWGLTSSRREVWLLAFKLSSHNSVNGLWKD